MLSSTRTEAVNVVWPWCKTSYFPPAKTLLPPRLSVPRKDIPLLLFSILEPMTYMTFAPWLCSMVHFQRWFCTICISWESPNMCTVGTTKVTRECQACSVVSAGLERGSAKKTEYMIFCTNFLLFLCVVNIGILLHCNNNHCITCCELICLQYPYLVKDPLKVGIYNASDEPKPHNNTYDKWIVAKNI